MRASGMLPIIMHCITWSSSVLLLVFLWFCVVLSEPASAGSSFDEHGDEARNSSLLDSRVGKTTADDSEQCSQSCIQIGKN
jgi:hypothetical protein